MKSINWQSHQSNEKHFFIFMNSQAKFLPLCGDMHIVSCARDGHIRMAELTSGGTFHSTRRLALHRGPAHKLALLVDTPQVFLSAGEDAVVFEVDVRQSKPNK